MKSAPLLIALSTIVLTSAILGGEGSGSVAGPPPLEEEETDQSSRLTIRIRATYDPEVTRLLTLNRTDVIVAEPDAGAPPGADWRPGNHPTVVVQLWTPEAHERYVVDRFNTNIDPDGPPQKASAGELLLWEPVSLRLSEQGKTRVQVDLPPGREYWLTARVNGLDGSAPYCDDGAVLYMGVYDPVVLNASTVDGAEMAVDTPFGFRCETGAGWFHTAAGPSASVAIAGLLLLAARPRK